MIDMNQVLAKVIGSTIPSAQSEPMAVPERAKPRAVSRQRIWPPHHPSDKYEISQETGRSSLVDQIGALGVGAAAGGLVGTLFGSKKMREVAGTVLQVGAVAAVGGLAYKAFQDYRQGKPVIPHGIADLLASGSPMSSSQTDTSARRWIPENQNAGETATLLLQAMVAAAAADGRLDKLEYMRIQEQLHASGFSGEEQLLLSQLLIHPSTIEDLAAAATTLEQRVEIYTAARLAIDMDTPSEHEWLVKLATAMEIPPQLKAHIDAIGGSPEAAAA